MKLCIEIKKHIGEQITIAHKRINNRVFFFTGKLTDVSPTHLFLEMNGKIDGFLLADITKMEFPSLKVGGGSHE